MAEPLWDGDVHIVLQTALALERAAQQHLGGMDAPSVVRTLYASAAALARAYRPAAEDPSPDLGGGEDVSATLEGLVAEVASQLAERWVGR
jgi:hypothetical protein